MQILKNPADYAAQIIDNYYGNAANARDGFWEAVRDGHLEKMPMKWLRAVDNEIRAKRAA